MIQVIVKNSKTGSQYICKSASKTVKDIAYKHISYHFVCRHKDHPFFKQLYHGPKGIYIGSERYKEIEALVSIHTPTQGVTLYLITYYKSANLIHCYANHHYYSTS